MGAGSSGNDVSWERGRPRRTRRSRERTPIPATLRTMWCCMSRPSSSLTIVVHNLCAPQLFIRGVHLSPEHFVQCTCPRQDNVRVLYLDHTLAKTQ